MIVVWAATHVHAANLLYAYGVRESWELETGKFKGNVAKAVTVLPEHEGLNFKHLLTMEMYAKPIDWKRTIDGTVVKPVKVIDAGPKRFATDGSEV